MHLTSNPAIWYAARASGVAAYVILSAVVAIGLALGGKAQSRRWPRFAVEEIHRFGGLLVGWLIVIHVGAIALDSFLPFSLGQLLIPFTAGYRPVWTGLGIFAAELLLALAITNRYRKRLPHRVWRLAHYSNFIVWGAASLHGIFAGTDRSAGWLAALYGASISIVVALLVWRIRGGSLTPGRIAAAGVAGMVVLPLILLGPLAKQPLAWNTPHVSERLTGEVIRNGTDLRQIVSFVGSARRPQKLIVRADLLVSPRRLDATSLQLEYLPSGDVCRGQITQVGLTSFAGTCRLPNGARRVIEAGWVPARTGVAGTISLHA